MCAQSLEIINRTVMFWTRPERRRAEVTAFIRQIRKTARAVL
jgi:hypothetical protein